MQFKFEKFNKIVNKPLNCFHGLTDKKTLS